MIKRLEFNYNSWDAFCILKVDTAKFKAEDATLLLELFDWDYDEDEDPIDAYMKKVAIKCIEVATSNNYNESGVIREFAEMEGWPYLDGSVGIELFNVEGYKFDEELLTIEVK